MLNWVNPFSIFLYLDSNNYQEAHGNYECLLAAGCVKEIKTGTHSLQELQQCHDREKDWLFGNICYDYKNHLEQKLHSAHPQRFNFEELFFFRPEIVCHINPGKTILTIESLTTDPQDIYQAITGAPAVMPAVHSQVHFVQHIDREQYLLAIETLRGHIKDGDCYEINYCNEGYAEDSDIEPLAVFNALNILSPAPFAAFYRYGTQYMMCSSPERYLQKLGDRVLSQPIKGTARRDKDKSKDEAIKTALSENIKERAENVMIVDLVRNDLAHSCETGSVKVDELFGIYSFPQVHQMISTVSGTLKADAGFTTAIRHSFPMGSMTGAPKVKVMQLIEQYEQARRGLYSGTVGYISPAGDIDLNVVIRSLFYNKDTAYLSYHTGGAITYDSSPVQEWEEMRLKAWAMERIFAGTDDHLL